MRKQIQALGVVVGLVGFGQIDQVHRFGPLGHRLTAEDVSEISRVSRSGQQAPWTLFAWYSRILPERWYADVFLTPTTSSPRLRRGEVQHLACTPSRKEAPCLHWEVVEKPSGYAQVADGPPFRNPVQIRRPSERPIRLYSELSDADVASLVVYIRSNPDPTPPKTANGWTRMGVSGAYPIMSIERQLDGSVWVVMSDDGRVGETAIVRKTQGGWQVTEVGSWVA
jgi:hypothetical protein